MHLIYREREIFCRTTHRTSCWKCICCSSSEERRTEEAAHILWSLITQAYREAVEYPWLPLPFLYCVKKQDLKSSSTSWKSSYLEKKSQNETREFILSLMTICYSVSNGQWKIARHLGLGRPTAVQHLTGSEELFACVFNHSECEVHTY